MPGVSQSCQVGKFALNSHPLLTLGPLSLDVGLLCHPILRSHPWVVLTKCLAFLIGCFCILDKLIPGGVAGIIHFSRSLS